MKIIIPLSEQEIWELQEEKIFRWDNYKTECGKTISVVIGKAENCEQCGEDFIPEGIVRGCPECEEVRK